MNVRIVNFPETKVAVLEHRGDPRRVFESVATFMEWRKATGLSPVKTSQSFGIAYDDPQSVAPENFRFDICGSVAKDVPANAQGVVTGRIPAGRCAVVRHTGSLDSIADSVYHLYRAWLPQSGEEVRDYPCFFEYLNLIPDVAEHELQTEVYLPLK